MVFTPAVLISNVEYYAMKETIIYIHPSFRKRQFIDLWWKRI